MPSKYAALSTNFLTPKKKKKEAYCWAPAAEIRRTVVESQIWQIVQESSSPK
jgi:hypothetical protein